MFDIQYFLPRIAEAERRRYVDRDPQRLARRWLSRSVARRSATQPAEAR